MTDLENLNDVAGEKLTREQVQGILRQLDLDILNLARDGKLSALKYAVGNDPKANVDRSANLKALLTARSHYEKLLWRMESREPSWEISQAVGSD